MKFTAAILAITMVLTVLSAPLGPSAGLWGNTSEDLPVQVQMADTTFDTISLLQGNKELIFDFSQKLASSGKDGEMIIANRATFHTLAGTNSGMAMGRIGPCGITIPHIHPRALELQVVIHGRLITEMVPENGVLNLDGKQRRLIRSELGPFQMAPFYEGYIHTQFNPDCEPAIFVAYFPSEDFGTLQTFDGSVENILAPTFGETVAGENIENLRNTISWSFAPGVEECLKKCGL